MNFPSFRTKNTSILLQPQMSPYPPRYVLDEESRRGGG